MTAYRRHYVPGGTYFFTVALAERSRRLLVDHIDLLRASFRQVKAAHPFEIVAIVILPDHLHTVWTLPDGDSDYSTRWRQIKSGFSRAQPYDERGRLRVRVNLISSPRSTRSRGRAKPCPRDYVKRWWQSMSPDE